MNFKGIRNRTINFDPVSTNIFGDNATGKTTLMDAFLWLLFGKDSSDRKDFEIKTLDENNTPYHKLEHEVSAILMIDGIEVSLRRCYREKWVKKRGLSTEEFTGHETTYYWNDVPMKQDEYQAKISNLVPESVFKLITNTTYFNSLKWQDRRGVLMAIAGDIDNESVISQMNAAGIDQLRSALESGKSIDEFRREMAAKKKKIKDELDTLPSRIEEAGRALPEKIDYDLVQSQIDQLQSDISDVDALISNKSQAEKARQDELTERAKKIGEIKRSIVQRESDIRNSFLTNSTARKSKISAAESELSSKSKELATLRSDYTRLADRSNMLNKEREDLRNKWGEVDSKSLIFNQNEFCCPTCKREYDAADVESKKSELTANFNADKSKQLADITSRGQQVKKEAEDLDVEIGNMKVKGEEMNKAIEEISARITNLKEEDARLQANESMDLQKMIEEDAQISELKAEIEGLESKNTPSPADDNSALMQRKRELGLQLDQLKANLAGKDFRSKQLARITELQDQERKQAQELASLEGIEFVCDEFIRVKMDTLERRVNGRFQLVTFKMFEDQINGGRVEACTTLINGVPYSDANTAGKIQAGLDIINTLSDHYGVQAPVWVDNRESVVTLPETGCQLINLIVSETDKKLRVATKSLVEAN